MDPALMPCTSEPGDRPAARAYDVALGRVRAFVVFLVVVHHSMLAYFPGVPPPADRFAGGEMLWRAFPVLDPERWPFTPLVVAFNDVFFMALMFLLSGLFSSGSVERKGVGRFLRDRVVRLGIPFLFAAGVVVPLAYYASYLQSGGVAGISGYWQAWRAIGYWPTGPAWFVLVLLLYDVIAAILFRIVPSWAGAIAGTARRAHDAPARLFCVVVCASLLAYAPLAAAYGPDAWTHLGLLQFQTSRVLHYFVYFAVGVGIGAAGLRDGLVAADGRLARRWWAWVAASILAFLAATVAFVAARGATGEAATALHALVAVTFALSCAASCFGVLAVFVRFAQRPSALWRSAADDSYGIYLVHYAFVTWCQYTLLAASLPAVAKAALVIVVSYLASWGTVALARRIPLVARIV